MLYVCICDKVWSINNCTQCYRLKSWTFTPLRSWCSWVLYLYDDPTIITELNHEDIQQLLPTPIPPPPPPSPKYLNLLLLLYLFIFNFKGIKCFNLNNSVWPFHDFFFCHRIQLLSRFKQNYSHSQQIISSTTSIFFKILLCRISDV